MVWLLYLCHIVYIDILLMLDNISPYRNKDCGEGLMDDDIAIKVEHVSKKFSRSLKKSMLYGAKDIGRNALGMSSKPEILRKKEL